MLNCKASSKLLIALTSFIFGFPALAEQETLSLKGQGVDQKDCSVEIVREGTELVSISLVGATKDFEIIAETAHGYGPHSSISPRGARDIEDFFTDTPKLLKMFKYTKAGWSSTEIYILSTKDIAKSKAANNDDSELKAIKGLFSFQLSFDETGKLKRMVADQSFKALGFLTLGSKKFICE